jgi:hypothetical protein
VVGDVSLPGAVSAEVVDDGGDRVAPAVGDGAYVAVINPACCRDAVAAQAAVGG